MKKSERIVRISAVAAAEMFIAVTAVFLVTTGRCGFNMTSGVISSAFMVLLPSLFEIVFKCRMNAVFYIVGVLYSVCPMLGTCYNFYEKFHWWDKMLHFTGGVVFAFVGFFLFELLVKGGGDKVAAAALFALCFSMAISVAWEFCEFTFDSLLGTDMQRDTVITEINSYNFSTEPGKVGSIKDIKSVTVNGEELPGGYLDVGLRDTMGDMLAESAGALITAALFFADRGRHPAVKMKKSKQSEAA